MVSRREMYSALEENSLFDTGIKYESHNMLGQVKEEAHLLKEEFPKNGFNDRIVHIKEEGFLKVEFPLDDFEDVCLNNETQDEKFSVCQGFLSSVQLKPEENLIDEPSELEDWNVNITSLSNTGRAKSISLHPTLERYGCCICKEYFPTTVMLARHMTTHVDRAFKCDVCNMSFSLNCRLKIHKLSHSGDRPFVCDVCKKSFPLKTKLRIHMRTHTGDRPFACDVCKKTFAEKGGLKRHMRTHTGDCPYKCDVCKKAFNEKANLTIHMLTHTGHRPFTCDICKKSFSLKRNLARHSVLHTGQVRFKCSVCVKTFSDRSNLRKHEKKCL